MTQKQIKAIIVFLLSAIFGSVAYFYGDSEPPGTNIQIEDQNHSPEAEASVSARPMEIPVCGAEQNESDHQIRKFENYTICYREQYEQPEWVAYELTKDELTKKAKRTNDFRPDPKILTGSAELSDYRRSGYDRGHLAPAADFAFSEKAMSETFFLSNMSPQVPEFDQGIWQKLESKVRTWATRFGSVYVVTGPVLEKPAEQYASIGANKVSVPQYYYKVILARTKKSVSGIGFILPNKRCDDSIWNYAVTIDEVEKRTGLDFFPLLDDETEATTESSLNLSLWK